MENLYIHVNENQLGDYVKQIINTKGYKLSPTLIIASHEEIACYSSAGLKASVFHTSSPYR